MPGTIKESDIPKKTYVDVWDCCGPWGYAIPWGVFKQYGIYPTGAHKNAEGFQSGFIFLWWTNDEITRLSYLENIQKYKDARIPIASICLQDYIVDGFPKWDALIDAIITAAKELNCFLVKPRSLC